MPLSVPSVTRFKQCSKCKRTWAAEWPFFGKHSKAGLQPRCRICRADTHVGRKRALLDMIGADPPQCCTVCKESKPACEFSHRQKGRRNRVTRCRQCTAAYLKVYYAKNKERHQRYHRERNLKREFGMTPEDYEELREQQGGGCAICGGVNGKGDLHVDHCHSSGKVRGLLCFKCNAAVGLLKDDPTLARKLADYLS